MSRSFRLILDGQRRPRVNMALDALLLEECLAAGGPFVRFYGWRPAGLSLGRYQTSLPDVDLGACRREGVEVVRRMTGGRAVLHHRELTYSVGATLEPPFHGGGVRDVYRIVSEALVCGLNGLGAGVGLSREKKAGPRTANCFASRMPWEISWRERKLVGSAQWRGKGAFLQHGSILLSIDDALWGRVFPGAPDARAGAVGLDEVLGGAPDADVLMRALAGGFEDRLGIRLAEEALAPHEIRSAESRCRPVDEPVDGL